MLIKTVPVTLFQQNVRLVIDSESSQAVLVDPGGEVGEILQLIETSNCEVSEIFITHSHIDHVGAVADCLEMLESRQGQRPRLLASEVERDFRQSITQQAMMFGVSTTEFKNCPEPDRYLQQGDVLWVGNNAFELFFTPGHAPGHFAGYCQKSELIIEWYQPGKLTTPLSRKQYNAPLVIAGDTLFAGSIGRTDLPGGSYDILIESIRSKLLTLPDETIVLSGHGPDTTIGREKTANPFLA